MKSIRTFLITVILSTITLVVFLSALNGYKDSMHKAEQLFDMALVDKAYLLSIVFSLFNENGYKPLSESRVINLMQAKHPEIKGNDVFMFQIWQDNSLLLRSLQTPKEPISDFKAGFQNKNIIGHRWRTYAFYNDKSHLWILTAERSDIRYVLAENIILETILPVIIMLPLLGILIWILISYGLSPLRKLAQELGNKKADDLSPLPVEQQPVELIQVVNSTNDLFNRLKASFLREKRFASDAAHELRTPISAIKIHLHNLALVVPGNNHSFQQLNDAVNRMGHLVEQILNLNRTSPEQYISRFTEVDLYTIAQEVIAREYQQFAEKDLQIELEGKHVHIDGDPFALDVLLQNLLSNACKYSNNGNSVCVSINTTEQSVELQVQDSGPGVPEDQYGRLFDRFYRLHGDRHDSGVTGCGLGLAIVQQIAELHQARIELGHSSFATGLSVKVIFNKKNVKTRDETRNNA